MKKLVYLALIMFIVFSYSVCPVQAEEPTRKPLKWVSVDELIDLAILISLQNNLQNSRGFVEGQYVLSPKLTDLKKKYGIGDCFVYHPPQALFGVWDDRVSIEPEQKETWLALGISCLNVEFPKIEFRGGELGIRKGEAYTQEGTEVRVEGKIYYFTNGRWKLVEKK